MMSLSQEEQGIVAMVREFVDREVGPAVREMEHANDYPVPCYVLITEELARGWMRQRNVMVSQLIGCGGL
jgi:hypothetical protein